MWKAPLVAAGLCVSAVHAAPAYRVVATHDASAVGINSSGQVVGYHLVSGSAFITGPDGVGQTFMGMGDFRPTGINASGQVSGNGGPTPDFAMITAPNGEAARGLDWTSFVWKSHAHAINDAGQVVGWATDANEKARGYVTEANGLNPRYIGEGVKDANDINNLGQVIGSYDDGRAFFTEANVGALHDLPGAGYAVNDRGAVTGSLAGKAFVYEGGAARELGALAGDIASEGYDINIHGAVVGSSTGSVSRRGFLYSDGTMYDLNALLVDPLPFKITSVRAINDAGWIVAGGPHPTLSGIGVSNMVVLAPAVPEADQYAMLLIGLGLVGAVAKRTKT